MSPRKSLETYLVGGAIRDKLLGLPVTDRDWVVIGSNSDQMLRMGFQPVGKDFPVFIDRDNGEEYALARTERKTNKGYHGFKFDTSSDITLEQDLARRDITINAMAEDKNGNLIDPFNGFRDLKNKTIRHVSDAFTEDPVRILRIARFAARFQFSIASDTQFLMSEMVKNGEVDTLVPERVWAEMHKALQTDSPQTFFKVLRNCGALAKILPEVDNLFGVPQTAKYHPEIDSGVHTFMVIEQAAKLSRDPMVRFAALVHDLGKAVTPESILPSHRGHEKNGLPLIKQLCKRLRVPKKFQSLALAVAEYHLHMHRMPELKPEKVLKMLEKTRCLNDDERAKQIALACIADARGRKGFEEREYPQASLFLAYQQATHKVASKTIAEQHTEGLHIQQAIRQARLEAIVALKPSRKSQKKTVKPN